MFNLTTFHIKKESLRFFATLVAGLTLFISGCAEFPGDEEKQDGELTLASKIERESKFVRVNNLATTASWNPSTRQLQLNGFRGEGRVAISNAATGQFIGTLEVDDDDDDDDRRVGGLVFQNITAVPCSVRVQINRRVQNVQVVNAPINCVGIAAASQVLHVDKAKWKNSSNKLTVKGAGAAPRQLVSVFDGITGQLLGTDQSNAVGNWKVKVRNMLSAPCSVSVVSGGNTISAPVDNAPLACSGIVNLPGNANFNQAPDGVIVGPFDDMAINAGGSINFMGTGFDPDSALPLTYHWTFDGAAPDSFQQNQQVVFTQPGVYVVSLTVMDSQGLADASPATRAIVVQPAFGVSQAPSGEIISPPTNIEINAGEYVNFMGSGFDPEGQAVSYVWNFAGGTPLDFNASNLANPGNVMYSTPGVYLVSLTVVDASNVSDPTPVYRAITVRGGNTGNPGGNPGSGLAPDGQITNPPTNTNVAIGATVNFSATAFDPDSTTTQGITYFWDFGGAAPNSNLQNPTVTFSQAGVYTVGLTVTDVSGLSDFTPSTRIITVGGTTNNPNNSAPVGTITLPTTTQTISVGQSVNFMGTGFDADGNNPLSYYWDFMGGAPNSTQQNPGAVVFSTPGTYQVSLTVTDSMGNQDLTPAIRVIQVVGSGGVVNNNLAPESTITKPAFDITNLQIGQSVEFEGLGTDPENDSPLIYEWTFDNAAPDSLVQNPGEVIFNQPGSYRVRLAVRDVNGNVDLSPDERIITVTNPSTVNILPPQTFITSPANNMTVNLGSSELFSGYATSNSGGNTISYEWDFGGAAPNSITAEPGFVTFNKPGIFKVTLYARNMLNMLDPTPEVRYITVLNTSTTGSNTAPEAKIISPAVDITVNAGDSILFSGAGDDSDNFGNGLTYNWNFGGGAQNSSQASPGLVTFAQPGVYTVSLNVMDSFGLSDTTPPTRTINVIGNQFNNNAPVVSIVSPTSQSTIATGGSLSFSANATDIDNEAITYSWYFDGAAPDSTLQTVSNVVFNTPGRYQVSVVATDARGKRSQPATRLVTVGGGIIDTSLNGVITSPAINMQIGVGETLNFIGSTSTGGQNQNLKYRWNFDGAAASSSAQNPGNVTFNRVGSYNVTMTVANLTGGTGTPVTRTITVGSSNDGGIGGVGPSGFITSPSQSNTNVALGGALNFTSTATTTNGLPATYRWTFAGPSAIADRFEQNPVNVVFPIAGTYVVTLYVTDSSGVQDATPEIRTITVGGGVNQTSALNGIIVSPSSSTTISRGQSISFSGNAETVSGSTTNVTYSWDFDGGATNSSSKTPGLVVFNTAGLYVVKLTVSDGVTVDSTPATQVVIVLP